MSLETCFTRSWYRARGWTWGLAPLLLLTTPYAKHKRRQFLAQRDQRYQSKCPVIVVGNISIGGTGKSPMVLALADYVRTLGYHPGIVTRGHKRQSDAPQLVSDQSSALEVGDEPLMLARRAHCPVAVATKRIDALKLLEQTGQVDVIISDDGMQHYAMNRDIEVVMVDAERALGNQQLLPVGPLREPVERLLEVDYAFAIGARFPLTLPIDTFCAPLEISELRSVTDPSRTLPLTALHTLNWTLVTGIGNPERFWQTLRDLGLDENTPQCLFADHHQFARHELPSHARIIMTEKDAVKIEAFAKPEDDWWYVAAKLELPTEFTNSLRLKLNSIVKQKT